jgi:hypothetical protein
VRPYAAPGPLLRSRFLSILDKVTCRFQTYFPNTKDLIAARKKLVRERQSISVDSQALDRIGFGAAASKINNGNTALTFGGLFHGNTIFRG